MAEEKEVPGVWFQGSESAAINYNNKVIPERLVDGR